MAGAIGRITASLASVQYENSASLANINFDFTLVKLEAPVEYSAVGTTISRKRKAEAEGGRLHKTARKLGALFEESLPRTEHLFRAYGKRVSEITSIPAINPRDGLDRGGFFANHIGAETTSIWAAVTSGSAAIAVHLLGCMLARMFPSAEAISVWVELVQKQKAEINGKQDDAMYGNEQWSSVAAAQQEVAREELASWDASARAWLQSADQAKELQHKQTMLILENASIPVNDDHDTYASVLRAWTSALQAMDNLLARIPQRIQDGAVLLAISSWHLYPDMAVFGSSCVEVKQKDPLFEPTALLTLGLQHVRKDTKGVFWSLPLACLQYYGRPVETSRTVCRENSRVSHQEFAYVILGCLFDGWKSFATTSEDGVKWILQLSHCLRLGADQVPNERTRDLKWFAFLFRAAKRFSGLDEAETRVAHQLMNLGRRRSTFLRPPVDAPQPLFGLCQVEIILPLLHDEEERIIFLRHLATQLKVRRESFLIRYQHMNVDHDDEEHIEFATIYPANRPSLKRAHDGQQKLSDEPSFRHIRWLVLDDYDLSLCLLHAHLIVNVPLATENLRKLEQEISEYDTCTIPVAHSPVDASVQREVEYQKRLAQISDLKKVIRIGQRLVAIEGKGEQCLPAMSFNDGLRLTKMGIFPHREDDFFDAVREIQDDIQGVVDDTRLLPKLWQTFFVGDEDASIVSARETVHLPTRGLGAKRASVPEPISSLVVSPKFLEEVLTRCTLDSSKLESYLLDSLYKHVQAEILGLRACAMMYEVYNLLPGATISTLVINQQLLRAKWLPSSQQRFSFEGLTLSQTFACIAMFETGTCNLNPNSLLEVFAMSSGNSLYIAGPLLCDPYEKASGTEVLRVIGNIGKGGITFLISPTEVSLRDADPEKWMAINHSPFDGKLEDCFTRTSVHLSFTEYQISLITEDNPRHIIDRAAFIVETLVSVYDGSDWVAEVDILKAFRSQVQRVACTDDHHKECNSHAAVEHTSPERKCQEALANLGQLRPISIENWDELIEAPDRGVIVIRAHKNWLARLAALAVCVRREFLPIILPEDPCWRCCAELISKKSNDKFALIC